VTRTAGELLDGILPPAAWSACAGLPVASICDDSRSAAPDAMFFALAGTRTDGRRFVQEAVARGARVIVGEDVGPVPGPAVAVPAPQARSVLARVAARWFELDRPPASDARLLAVTGTNGKSTTAFMTAQILRAAGRPCGMIGTVRNELCGREFTASMTTPGPIELSAFVAECARGGASAIVMEASSHALSQRRTDGLRFAAAAFTNLTRDHLDYHADMDAYADAKAHLFASLDESAVAVVNADDPAHTRMIRGCRARVMTFGVASGAALRATIEKDALSGTRYALEFDGRRHALEHRLVGRHNVYNALAAAGLALGAGVSIDDVRAGLATVTAVPGRLERVPGARGMEIFVDYAHTPDALENVAAVLRPLTRGRLIVVFGCGGDRDRGKRPMMARVAARYADAILVTSDNPRSEEPRAIISDILVGFEPADARKAVVEPDREAAIHAAVLGGQPGDVVLIAGKGHEDYQIIGDQRLYFDDVQVARRAIEALAGAAQGAA